MADRSPANIKAGRTGIRPSATPNKTAPIPMPVMILADTELDLSGTALDIIASLLILINAAKAPERTPIAAKITAKGRTEGTKKPINNIPTAP